ncbi:hypothetical protein ACN47E_003237 [Coniothyrium glycines]
MSSLDVRARDSTVQPATLPVPCSSAHPLPQSCDSCLSHAGTRLLASPVRPPPVPICQRLGGVNGQRQHRRLPSPESPHSNGAVRGPLAWICMPPNPDHPLTRWKDHFSGPC